MSPQPEGLPALPDWPRGPALLGRAKVAPILRGRWRRDARLQQFLAFGFVPDHDLAHRALDAYDGMRRAWLDEHGPDDLDDAGILALLDHVVADALLPHQDSPLVLGLSAGFDSRPLLYAARRSGREPALFTFGAPGYLDFDMVRLYAERSGVPVDVLDSNEIDWSLHTIDENALTATDLPISPRALALRRQADLHPDALSLHGWINGALTGNNRPMGRAYRELTAEQVFVMKNDPFALQSLLPPEPVAHVLREAAVSPDRGLDAFRQFDLGYRQRQRTRPPEGGSPAHLLPYDDARWIGYWLSRPVEQSHFQRRWTDFVRGLDDELFFDIRGLTEQGWDFNRARLRRIYGDDETPGYIDLLTVTTALPAHPKNHFDLYACWRNNASFRAMIAESIARLRGRRVFDDGFVDTVLAAFEDGDPDAAKRLNALVTTDTALEAGRF